MRFLSLFVLVLVFLYLFLQGRTIERSAEKPVFLRVDKIARSHETEIQVICHARYCPDSLQLKAFTQDYKDLWAHLNHAYASNDILTGKEFYTENWFRQLASHYQGTIPSPITRSDLRHQLHIQNWSSDNLVCTAIDSNVVLQYDYPGQKRKFTKAHIAMVLLYQGDHWRIEALKVLDEQEQE